MAEKGLVREEFVKRKLQLIAEDLGRLQFFQDHSLEEISGDFVKLAAVERLLERIVMRAIDINEHLVSQLADPRAENITRLTYRDTFLKLADIGALPSGRGSCARTCGVTNVDIRRVPHQTSLKFGRTVQRA